MTTTPYKTEQTGIPMLDRIQREIARAIDAIRAIEVRLAEPVRVSTSKDWSTTSVVAATTPLGLRVKKGELWNVVMTGRAGNSGSAGGMKWAVLAPPGSTCFGHIDSSLGNSDTSTHSPITAANTLTGAVHTVNGNLRADRISVRVKAGADGRIDIAIATATGGDTATLGAYSFLEAHRYTEVTNG